MLLSAAAQPGRSWAGLIALAAAYVIFRVGTWVWTNKIKKPSPTLALGSAKRVKVQATVGVNTDDTDRVQEFGWGRISHESGRRMKQLRNVWKTGHHELPAAGEPDDDVDLPLDDEPEGADERVETAEEYIARCRDLKAPYARIVRVLEQHYGLTTDQAKYRIRKVDAGRGGQAAA